MVGWNGADIRNAGFVDVEMLGRIFLVSTEALEMLKDRQLVLESVNVGFPSPVERLMHLLISRPRS